MKSIPISLLLVFGCCSLVGCAAFITYPTFTLYPGQSWDMQAQNGDLTHFETVAIQNVGCQSGELLDIHTTKSQARSYWQPGLAGADLHWILHRDNRGNWHAVTSLINWDQAANPGIPHTINYIPLNANAYLIIPGRYRGRVTRTGYANWWADFNGQTSSCLKGVGYGPKKLRWTARFSISNVDTTVYKGPALAAEQFEGCWADGETAQQTKCAHEIWYFAQGIGLVEINSIWEHTIIKRIN